MKRILRTISVTSTKWFLLVVMALASANVGAAFTIGRIMSPEEAREFEILHGSPILKPVTIEGWHCVDTEFIEVSSATKNVIVDYSKDKLGYYLKKCSREMGYGSDGIVYWRRPKQAIKDAEYREQKSLKYK